MKKYFILGSVLLISVTPINQALSASQQIMQISACDSLSRNEGGRGTSEIRGILNQTADEIENTWRKCEYEYKYGPNAIVIETLSKTNFISSLKAAQEQRKNAYLSVYKSVKDLNQDLTSKVKESGITNLPDSFFINKMEQLKEFQLQLNTVKASVFSNYLENSIRVALEKLHQLPQYQLNLGGLIVLNKIDVQFDNAQKSSDFVVQELSTKIENYISASLNSISNLRTNLSYEKNIDAIAEFQKALEPEVLKLEASVVWGRFLNTARIYKILSKSDFDLRTGFVKSAQEKFNVANVLVERFLSRFPKRFVEYVKQSDSYVQLIQKNQIRSENLKSVTGQEIDDRQNEYVPYLSSLFDGVKLACVKKYPQFDDKFKTLEADFSNTKNTTVWNAIDPEVRRFLMESMGNRFDIYLELCEEFQK